MSDIRNASKEELLAELQRREKAAYAKPLANPDFSNLRETVIDGVNTAIENKYKDDDFKQWVFESAMEAVYGPNGS